MRSITGNWFEVTIRYIKSQEEGTSKKVTERYAIDAVSFTEAETRITEEITDNAWQDCKITSEAQAAYGEIIFSGNEEDKNWYKCKVVYINIDEHTGKKKTTKVSYLVQARSITGAIANVNDALKSALCDYEIINATKTDIVVVIERK